MERSTEKKMRFLEDVKNKNSFYFNGNENINIDTTGFVNYNYHGTDQYYFRDISSFSQWFFENANVPYLYSKYIGNRSETGVVSLHEDIDTNISIDEDEDGSCVWSSPVLFYEGKESSNIWSRNIPLDCDKIGIDFRLLLLGIYDEVTENINREDDNQQKLLTETVLAALSAFSMKMNTPESAICKSIEGMVLVNGNGFTDEDILDSILEYIIDVKTASICLDSIGRAEILAGQECQIQGRTETFTIEKIITDNTNGFDFHSLPAFSLLDEMGETLVLGFGNGYDTIISETDSGFVTHLFSK